MSDAIALEAAHVLIVGVVRNCRDTLRSTYDRLSHALSAANKLSFFVVESDSSDGTPEVLEQLAASHDNFNFRSLGRLSEQIHKRTERIALCRNAYLEELQRNPAYQEVDYVVIADWDGVNDLVTEKGIASCWERVDWDVCTANQAGPYYDIWALRHSLWSPNDCWEQQEFLIRMGMNPLRARRLAVHSRMLVIPPASDWIEVQSAFGGLAIYRRSALESVRYVGVTDDGKEVCEHVSLHQEIRAKGGKLFINPALVNTGLVDHAKYATRYGKMRYFVKEARRLVLFSR